MEKNMETNNKNVADEFKKCPCCGSSDYEYALTWGTLVSESVSAITDFDVKKMIVLPIIREIFVSGPASFIRSVFQDVPESPALLCKKCRSYILCCPNCDAYFSVSEFPKSASIYRCPDCNTGFQICENDDKFNKIMGKKNSLQWISAIIGVIILIMVINYLINTFK
jgi:hypothetical protein